MSNKGIYPKSTVSSTDSLLKWTPAKSLLFSVTKPSEEIEKTHYFGLYWAFVSEIRFWASIVFSLPEEEAELLTFYPFCEHINYKSDTAYKNGIEDEEFQKEISDFIWTKISGLDFYFSSYDFRYEVDKKKQKLVYEGIDTKNYILIRGLSCLLKSKLLTSHNLFTEEAALLVYISLEAAINILRTKLMKIDPKYSKISEIIQWVEEIIPSKYSLIPAFEECYEKRVMIVHPKNKYGDFCYPPLDHDDYYDYYPFVQFVYRELILGKKYLDGVN